MGNTPLVRLRLVYYDDFCTNHIVQRDTFFFFFEIIADSLLYAFSFLKNHMLPHKCKIVTIFNESVMDHFTRILDIWLGDQVDDE